MGEKKKGKKFWSMIAGVFIVFILLMVYVGENSADTKALSSEVTSMEADLEEKDDLIAELEGDLEEKNSQIVEMKTKLEKAEPWFILSEKEKERKLAEEKKKQEAEEAAAEKKAAEEKAKKEAAEEEARKKKVAEAKKGYETGITFDELARNPDEYIGDKVKLSGKVIQVIEGEASQTQLRIAVNDDYDRVVYAAYDSSIVDSRILEDDQITIMGISSGLLTYQSTMGGDITIPAVKIDVIEQ